MPPSPEAFSDVARAIQLALTPVFLLTAISGLLGVMAGRLSRIIDRGRVLTERPPASTGSGLGSLPDQLRELDRRRHLCSVAITACTIAALLVCMVIATIFLEMLLAAPLNWLIGLLFTAAVLALVIGLSFFLREVHQAMLSVRIAPPGSRPVS
jgi:hypothetical protein